MKYSLLFLSFFLLAAPAYAAKQVKGTVPQVQPLQPPPAGINANTHNNIQNQAPESQNQDAGTQSPGQALGNQPTAAQNGDAQQQKKSSSWIWWILTLVLLGFVTWQVKRSRA